MAISKIIEMIFKVRGAGKAAQQTKKVDKSLVSLGKSAMKLGGTFFAARGIISGLSKVITLSSKMEGVRRGFNNLTKSAGFSAQVFSKLQKATDGTMNSMDLMKQANNAMLLGIFESEDQMAKMFDTAQRLAQALGKDAAFGIESLVTGMGRQSKLMLDNLGIMVKAEDAYKRHADGLGTTVAGLTDAQKKQAFVNEAMKEANKLVKNLGAEQLTTADTINQMKTAVSDAGASLGSLLAPTIITVAEGLKSAAEWARRFFDRIRPRTIQDAIKGMQELGMATEKIAKLQKLQLIQEVAELGKEMRLMGINASDSAEITKQLEVATKDLESQYGTLVVKMKAAEKAEHKNTISFDRRRRTLAKREVTRTENLIKETLAEMENLQAKHNLIRAYELAEEHLESFNTTQEEAFQRSLEVTGAYISQTLTLRKLPEGYKDLVAAIDEVIAKTKKLGAVEQEVYATTIAGVVSMIKAKLAQAAASAVAAEMGKGLVGLITGTAAAIGVTALWDQFVTPNLTGFTGQTPTVNNHFHIAGVDDSYVRNQLLPAMRRVQSYG